MAKERRKDASSSDSDDLGKSSICNDSYDNKKKEGSPISFIVQVTSVIPGTRKNLLTLASDCKQNPAQATKRVVFKLFLYAWVVIVLVSVLSLLGFPLNPFPADSGVVSDTNADNQGTIQGMMNMFSFASEESADKDEDDKKKEEEEDIIPQQILPDAPKMGNKVNKKLERELACVEVTCQNDCNKKIKPKCAKSASCRKEREKLCRRRCRKARCEERCKDEPKFGYVEREQRMEKCKDECDGPTPVHNKCIKKCHSQFKPCKSRCHEIAGKFQCDKVGVVAKPPPIPVEEPKATSKQAPKSTTLDLLSEDAEMI